MCGIFAYVGHKNNAPKTVLEGLKRLEYRGYDSWGVAISLLKKGSKIEDENIKNLIQVKKKAGKIGDANVDDLPASDLGFGHTRWATHGGVTDVNAHPHLDCSGKISVIHNGIVENYEELRKKLKKIGHKFISETDTEVIAHLIEENEKTMMFTKAVQKAFNELEGLNAIIVMDVAEHKFVAARNGSPLVVGFGTGENFLASDAAALIPHTKQVHYLEDEQMAIISERGVMIFDSKSGEYIHPKKQKLTWSVSQVEKGKHPFFMIKEIHDQPGMLSDIATNQLSYIKKLTSVIKSAQGIYLVGCGTAGHAAISGAYLLSKIAHKHANWVVGSEFTYQQEFLTKKSLVIALSQSGETMDTLEAIKKAKTKGATIVGLVNVLGSTLYRASDHNVLLMAGVEKSVASTKAFTAKIAHLLLLSYCLSGNSELGQELVTKAAKSVKDIIGGKIEEEVKKLANNIKNEKHIYVIGRGLAYPTSLETALKIKEVSYIHAEGFAAGELKHGVIALIEKNTPCIAYLPNDETYGANLAGAMEMKARGGMIIGISNKPHEIFDYYIPVKDIGEATIIPNIVIGQLLAYYLAIAKNLDPDMPRNLAKSVTVK